MKSLSPIALLFFVLFSFSLGAPTARGAEGGVLYKGADMASKLRLKHVREARITEGGLLLRGDKYLLIGPVNSLTVPLRRVAVEIRFKTLKSLYCNIIVRSAGGWQAAKSIKVKGASQVTVLRLYLGRAAATDDTVDIDNFGISFFGTEKIDVRLDGLRFYDPGALGLIPLYWEEFWRPDFISGATVGFVATPEAGGLGFLSMLYIFIGLAFITALVVCKVRGRRLSPRKALGIFCIISLIAGTFFTLRMDYNWLSVFVDDVKTLSPVDVGQRVRILNHKSPGSIFDFVDYIKKRLPSGSTISPAVAGLNTPLAVFARYYLLPFEASVEADFLWSYGEALQVNPLTGALFDIDGKILAPKVRLFARYDDNAAIYKVIK